MQRNTGTSIAFRILPSNKPGEFTTEQAMKRLQIIIDNSGLWRESMMEQLPLTPDTKKIIVDYVGFDEGEIPPPGKEVAAKSIVRRGMVRD